MKSLFSLFSGRKPAPPDTAAAEHAGELIRQGNALEDLGQFDAARSMYLQAIDAAPDLADAHFNLGNAVSMLGRAGEALSCYRRAIELQPDNANAHLNLGATLLRCQSPSSAESAYREALRLRPESPSGWTGLGCALEANSKADEAVTAFERALAIDPANEGAASRLAQLVRERGEAVSALDVIDRCLRKNPQSILLLRTRADICGGVGEYEAAIGAYRQVLALSGGADLSAFSNLLWTMNFLPDAEPAQILAEHEKFGALMAQAVQRSRHDGADGHQRIRIGYVSADLRRHSVACFVEPLLRHHDRKSFEIHCFYDYGTWDDVTERIQKLPERWHEIDGMPDEEVARLIADCNIDILVDLAGHSAHNRMRLFAMKPARVQFTWLGYLCTTGLSAIDYRICDAYTDPVGVAESWQVEIPARLPRSQWCYQPQVELPAPSPLLPRITKGYWTFASFNQESKLNEVALNAWCAALSAIPDSRLRVFGVSCDIVAARIERVFAAHGLSPSRLDLVGRLPIDEYFASFREIDVALDTFPYNGATTTCDALLMGVPVATVAGGRAIARGGVSLLSTLGLTQWIAQTPGELVDVLRAQLADIDGMVALRSALPAQVRASALMDAAAFTSGFEEMLRRTAGPKLL